MLKSERYRRLDVALGALFGRAQGLPVYRLLGGKTRDRIRVYNTCAGYRYSGHTRGGYHATANAASDDRPYEDL